MLITATQIHNGLHWMPEGTTLEIDSTGKISNILPSPTAETIVYEGVICPGFVNVHCHMELSHMKGAIPEHTGLIPFLKHIPTFRNSYSELQKQEARLAAYESMIANGIVAVGDIANTADTADLRALDGMHIHTFVECIGFTEANAEKAFDYSRQTYEVLSAQASQHHRLQQSITPHAPYSVSRRLFDIIGQFKANTVLSIHNQESKAEDEFYQHRTGDVTQLLSGLGIDYSGFETATTSSLQTYTPYLSDQKRNIIYVHNTYTQAADIAFADATVADLYWCLCPNANLYIENALPPVEKLLSSKGDICIGTDSLASNHQLNILDELVVLKHNFTNLNWEQLLQWGTYNGAKALKMNDVCGTLEIGKTPGINLIENINSSAPSVKKIA